MKANFIWGVAGDILRSTFKPSEYGEVILPFVVMRRLDSVHEPYAEQVAEFYEANRGVFTDDSALDDAIKQQADDLGFANRSGMTCGLMAQLPKDIGGISTFPAAASPGTSARSSTPTSSTRSSRSSSVTAAST